MARCRRPPSQSWKTFLRNHAATIAAMDLLVVPTVGFRLLHVLIILGHHRRRLLSFGITSHPTAELMARQIIDAFPWTEAPRYLIRDRDAVYGQVAGSGGSFQCLSSVACTTNTVGRSFR
jgi:hypothetical protein